MSYFDPTRCELARKPHKLERFVNILTGVLSGQIEVVGVLEIGSYAKEEAVATSDIDLRVYLNAPHAYLFNGPPDRNSPSYRRFVAACGILPRCDLDWLDFNDTLAVRLSEQLGSSLEFGLADWRYADFGLSNLDEFFSPEHALLFQSNILFDPHTLLITQRRHLQGRHFAALDQHYREHFMDRLSNRLPQFLEPHPWDAEKLARSGQIQWVQQAVRCLREAVAFKSYIVTGDYLYKKRDVLHFYQQHLPTDFPFVQKLYNWKMHAQTRAELVRAFQHDPEQCYIHFRRAMPQLTAIVKRVQEMTWRG